MKYYKILFLIPVLFVSVAVKSQTIDQIKERVYKNYQILVKDSQIHDQVFINKYGIELRGYQSDDIEFRISWSEIPKMIEMYQKKNYWDMIEFYDEKGTSPIWLKEGDMEVDIKYPPTSLEGLKVALDPGHFAGNYEEAVKERKYVKLKGYRVGQSEDIKFYEADLAYATAVIIKKELEKLGAEVLISREKGVSAVGIPFDQWYATKLEEDVAMLVKTGELRKEIGDRIINRWGVSHEWDAFKYVYEYMDFVGRSRRINSWNPDLTFIIHYNADEYSERANEGYWDPTEANYSMFFVPGSFMRNELIKKDARIDFLRLLITDNLEESMYLAETIAQMHDKVLGVPRYDNPDNSITLSNTSIPIDNSPGVYARNLYLTRSIKSPIVYVESLYQDNVEEAKRLVLKDFKIEEGYYTSSRVKEVADAYVESVKEWIDKNRENLATRSN